MDWLPEPVQERLARAKRLWLFLDYDGTLAEFALTPEIVIPDPSIVDLLRRLAARPHTRVAVVSGRRLRHVQKLAPVPGILLAGTYGIELQTPEGKRVDRLDYDTIRPLLDKLKPEWAELLAEREGFFLEDKGWALALHARFAEEEEARDVLATARNMAGTAEETAPGKRFRLLGGHRFLEISPRQANKGHTVEYVLDEYRWPGALPLYVGDDDKDEEAFEVVKQRGGVTILVASEQRETAAECRLASPQAALLWLETLVDTHGQQI